MLSDQHVAVSALLRRPRPAQRTMLAGPGMAAATHAQSLAPGPAAWRQTSRSHAARDLRRGARKGRA